MERCCGQAVMVHADHVNLWWGVEPLIPPLKHTNEFYFHVRPMPTRRKCIGRILIPAKMAQLAKSLSLE